MWFYAIVWTVSIITMAIMLRRTKKKLAIAKKDAQHNWNLFIDETFKKLEYKTLLEKMSADWEYERNAVEQGRQEQEDNYEQQFLTFVETIGKNGTVIQQLMDDREALLESVVDCLQHDLPRLEDMDLIMGEFESDLYAETPLYDSVVLSHE